MMELIPSGDEEGEYTEAFRISLLKARLEIRSGKIISHVKVKEMFSEIGKQNIEAIGHRKNIYH